MSSRISLDPRETNPVKGDIVTFKHLGQQWKVTKVAAPNLYLRSVDGNRFEVQPMVNVVAIWRDPQQKAELDFTEYYEGILV
jgi:hypothetical protein